MKIIFHEPYLEHKHQNQESTSQHKSVMKTFLVLALLAMGVTMATAQFDPSEQYQPDPEQQQPFLQQQQPFSGQQPFSHPLQQQLNPCKQFLMKQCSPMAVVSLPRLMIFQQIGCLVSKYQCCRQLQKIPEQLRYPAIHSIVQSIILQQQQSQQQQQFFQPQQQQGFFQPQQTQGFFQPQQQAQLAFAMQALPAMCDVYVPPQFSVGTGPFGGF